MTQLLLRLGQDTQEQGGNGAEMWRDCGDARFLNQLRDCCNRGLKMLCLHQKSSQMQVVPS